MESVEEEEEDDKEENYNGEGNSKKCLLPGSIEGTVQFFICE